MRAILEDYFAKMLKIDHDVIRQAMHASHTNEGALQYIIVLQCFPVRRSAQNRLCRDQMGWRLAHLYVYIQIHICIYL